MRKSPAFLAMQVLLTFATLTATTGCGGGANDRTGEAGDRPPAAAAAKPARPQCRNVRPRKARGVAYRAPGQTVGKGERLTAVVRTNCGAFSIALDAKRFPTTVNSFVFLARRGFYDGVQLDKAGAGRYLHGGDPTGRADGPGYTVPGRIPAGFIYRHGVVAMAEPDQAGYGRAGSQFFIVLAKPWLDFTEVYPPLGTIKRGFGMLNAISHLGPRAGYFSNPGVLGPIGKLRRSVVIEDISIEKGKG
jgi:cyclophilin family peptidyl-prolyl cis-trans isomerase